MYPRSEGAADRQTYGRLEPSIRCRCGRCDKRLDLTRGHMLESHVEKPRAGSFEGDLACGHQFSASVLLVGC